VRKNWFAGTSSLRPLLYREMHISPSSNRRKLFLPFSLSLPLSLSLPGYLFNPSRGTLQHGMQPQTLAFHRRHETINPRAWVHSFHCLKCKQAAKSTRCLYAPIYKQHLRRTLDSTWQVQNHRWHDGMCSTINKWPGAQKAKTPARLALAPSVCTLFLRSTGRLVCSRPRPTRLRANFQSMNRWLRTPCFPTNRKGSQVSVPTHVPLPLEVPYLPSWAGLG